MQELITQIPPRAKKACHKICTNEKFALHRPRLLAKKDRKGGLHAGSSEYFRLEQTQQLREYLHILPCSADSHDFHWLHWFHMSRSPKEMISPRKMHPMPRLWHLGSKPLVPTLLTAESMWRPVAPRSPSWECAERDMQGTFRTCCSHLDDIWIFLMPFWWPSDLTPSGLTLAAQTHSLIHTAAMYAKLYINSSKFHPSCTGPAHFSFPYFSIDSLRRWTCDKATLMSSTVVARSQRYPGLCKFAGDRHWLAVSSLGARCGKMHI